MLAARNEASGEGDRLEMLCRAPPSGHDANLDKMRKMKTYDGFLATAAATEMDIKDLEGRRRIY